MLHILLQHRVALQTEKGQTDEPEAELEHFHVHILLYIHQTRLRVYMNKFSEQTKLCIV